MNDKELDDIISRAFEDERTLPKGLTQRLEARIDSYAHESRRAEKKHRQRRLIYRLMTTAAAVIIGIVCFTYLAKEEGFQDTFDDPYEAAIVTQGAFEMLSYQLQRGTLPVNKVKEQMDKTNERLSRQLKLFNEINHKEQ